MRIPSEPNQPPSFAEHQRNAPQAVGKKHRHIWKNFGDLAHQTSRVSAASYPTTITFQRKVLRPITLSDGTYLPSGTLAFSLSNAISSDPTIYADADKFDGLRFYKLRQASPDEEKKYQLTSMSNTQILFSSGKYACPGRWFASHEIKLVLASMLKRYEFKLNEGKGRPKNLLFQAQHVPDPTATILFKSFKP